MQMQRDLPSTEAPAQLLRAEASSITIGDVMQVFLDPENDAPSQELKKAYLEKIMEALKRQAQTLSKTHSR